MAHILFVVVIVLIGCFLAAFYVPNEIQVATGFAGSAASLVALLYTVYQVLETKKAADAARDAAAEAFDRARESSYRYGLQRAKRMLSEARNAIAVRHWAFARIRLNDVADEASYLAFVTGNVDVEWQRSPEILRYWGRQFERLPDGEPFAFRRGQFEEFCDRITEKIDSESGPFSGVGATDVN